MQIASLSFGAKEDNIHIDIWLKADPMYYLEKWGAGRGGAGRKH